MSVIRLLVSGLLVASGLTLGALTMHGAFDPPGPHAPALALGAQGPAVKPWSTNTLETKTRAVPARADAAEPPQPRAGQKPGAPSPGAGATDAAKLAADRARKKKQADKRLEEKRLAEKRLADEARKAKEPPQQAAVQWPWSWIGN